MKSEDKNMKTKRGFLDVDNQFTEDAEGRNMKRCARDEDLTGNHSFVIAHF